MTMTVIDRSGCTATHHGTNYAYSRYRCRCPDARAAKFRPQVHGTGRHGYSLTAYDPDNVAIALTRIRTGGPPPVISVPERRAVVAALTRAGWGAARIATALGLAQRSVVRHRAAVRTTTT